MPHGRDLEPLAVSERQIMGVFSFRSLASQLCLIHDDLRRATVALADCSRSAWEWAPGILHLKLARACSLFGTTQPTELDHFGIKCCTLRPQAHRWSFWV